VLRVARAPGGTLRIDVEDTGVGIAPGELEEIFDPFKQVEAGKAAGGTGLGLAITRRLVAALGGEISVTSELRQGSTFTVTLPLREAGEGDLPKPVGNERPEARQWTLLAGQERTVLLADDQKTNREILQGMLAAAGFRTLVASDGEEALELLRKGGPVDLVLMDVKMPGLGGFGALKRIRADGRLRGLKVIAVTASVFPEHRRKAIEEGFDDFLAKPFRMEELMETLKKHLDVELVPSAAVEEPPPRELEADREGRRSVPPEAVRRLRDALRIKNVTALKAVAGELSARAATAAVGEEIATLAGSFDFQKLTGLLEDLERGNGPDGPVTPGR